MLGIYFFMLFCNSPGSYKKVEFFLSVSLAVWHHVVSQLCICSLSYKYEWPRHEDEFGFISTDTRRKEGKAFSEE